jgi:hypothetical protein
MHVYVEKTDVVFKGVVFELATHGYSGILYDNI